MQNNFIVDLRSEGEFKNGTIFNAINMPILNDKEREEVGYTYVNKSVCDAKRLALKYAGYKLENMFDKLSSEFSQNKNIILFCARGGMRSESVHSLFNSIGIKNYKLNKGYKGYRKFVCDEFPKILEKINFIVIHGKTGIGKTKILGILKENGYPVIDLEMAANHRASFLGGVNLGEQNSQKQFESIVFSELMGIVKNFDFGENQKINVFVEGESKRIGKIILPECLFETMNGGTHICVDLPVDIRIKNLIMDYFDVSEEDFIKNNYFVKENILNDFKESMISLKKYSSNEDMLIYFDFFNQKKYEDLALSLIKNYYDPKYMNSMKKHNFKFNFTLNSMEEFVEEMENLYKNKI